MFPLHHLFRPQSVVESTICWQRPTSLDFHHPAGLHVWKVDTTNLSATQFLNFLSGEEHTQILRYRNPKDRNRRMISRGIRKELSASYLKTNHKGLNCRTNRFGKPFYTNHNHLLQFNSSHSTGMVLLVFGFSPLPLGIDIETINLSFDFSDIADHYFSTTEKESLNCKHATEQFFKIWTRKEALMKALGQGLQDRLFEIDVLSDQIKYDQGFHVKTFKEKDQYIFSVASMEAQAQIQFFEYNRL